jgi:prephenate dehydrogenase
MNVAVLGVGLIGGSLAAGLRGLGHRVVGWDPNPAAGAVALDRGLVDLIVDDPEEALAGADLAVLAGPPDAVVATIASLSIDGLVIDVAGVKRPVVAAAAARFVGTHPMAGREHGGPEHASPGLFRGANWVVVGDGADPADVDFVVRLVEELGANPVLLSAERHDMAVAAISHLPQVVAGALVEHATAESDRLDLAAGSFRDLTRVALSDPATWIQVLTANAGEVVPQLHELAARLVGVADVIESGDTESLEAFLSSAREHRQALAPPVVPVRVILEDRPGELGRVGAALAESRVDVRDLQLRHGRHGGGGVLTLSVRPGEAEALASALADQGFELA